MSILRSVLGMPDRRIVPLDEWEAYLDSRFAVGSHAGEPVTFDSAMTLSAVWAAVRRISTDTGSLPLNLYKERKDGRGCDLARDDEQYEFFKLAPNKEQTKSQFWETMTIPAVARGNSFAFMERNSSGRVVQAWPIEFDRVEQIERKNGELVYKIRPASGMGIAQPYTREEVMHFALFSTDGILGLSPIGFARNSIGLNLSQERFASALFSNGAMPGGFITTEVDAHLNQDEVDAAALAWKEANQGVKNAHKTAFLPGGFKFEQLSLNAEDAQFLESRKFGISDVSRWFGVPAHLLGDLERATFSNIEHQSLNYVVYCLRLWLNAWEQIISLQVLTKRQRQEGYYVKFNELALLRGDIKSQAEANNVKILNGSLSVNEARALEDRNPIAGGDKHLMPLNMTTVGAPAPVLDGKKKENQRMFWGDEDYRVAEPGLNNPEEFRKAYPWRQEASEQELQESHVRLMTWGLQRLVNKEAAAISKNLRKHTPAEFDAWLTRFYQETKEEYRDLLGSHADAYFNGSMAAVRGLWTGATELVLAGNEPDVWRRFTEDVEILLGVWKDKRAQEWAERRTEYLFRSEEDGSAA